MQSNLENEPEFKYFVDFLKKHSKDIYWGRMGKTFRNNVGYFYYDTGTGKVAKVQKGVFVVLKYLLENNGELEVYLKNSELEKKELLESLEIICKGIKQDNLLSAPKYEGMDIPSKKGLESKYDDLQNLTLEVTEDCNFRCKYCIYNEDHPDYRGFTKFKMSIDTAKKAIDFFAKHSNTQKVYFGFYGGEPLMNFTLIKESVEYIDMVFKGKDIVYSMTTNASMINQNIAEFLIKNNFNIMVSLDGDQETHDKNRVFPNGKGTFESTFRGIKNIFECSKAAGLERPKISFNMVNAGPDFEGNYHKMSELYHEMGWAEKEIPILTTMVDRGPKKHEYVLPQSQKELKMIAGKIEPLFDFVKKDDNINNFTQGTINRGLLNIHYRQISDQPLNNFGINACCVPGQRRLYVKTDGQFLPCEKVGEAPYLGNVIDGMDIDTIKKEYFDKFSEQAEKSCQNCWALNLCGLCYVNCFSKKGCDLSYRNLSCVSERIFIESNLKLYHELVETNPDYILTLNDIVVS
ncbi:radical SAM protein [Enterococcus faecalis]